MADTPAIWLPPFQVNVADAAVGGGGTNQQSAPYVAALPDGGAVIVWEDYGVRCVFEPADVAFRRLDVAGLRTGSEVPCVNAALDWAQSNVSYVPVSADRGYAIYQRDDDPALKDDVWFDTVTNDGAAIGDPAYHFVVTNANESQPTGALLTGGQFAIAFSDDTAGEYDLMFDVVPDPLTAPSVHRGKATLADGTGEAVDPDMAALSDGNFVVAYAQQTGALHDLRFVIRQPGGTAVTVADPLIASGADDLRDPAVAALPAGGFVVTWASPAGIFGRVYSDAGVAVGSAFDVDGSAAGEQRDPDVVATAGGILLAWTDVPSNRVAVRRATPAGALTGTEVRLAAPSGIATEPSLARLTDGRVAIAFTGTRAGNANVFAAILDDRDGPVTGTAAGETLTAPGGGGGVSGLGGADTLYGSQKTDSLDGGSAVDVMIGRAGSDTYTIDRVTDTVTEAAGQGTDTVRSPVSYTLPANVENLTLIGADPVAATGNGLANILVGNAGANRLSGLAGVDTLFGKAGADTFVLAGPLTDADADVVADFDAADLVQLARSVMPALPAGTILPATAFRAGAAAGTPAERVLYDGATGRLSYDADGTGPAVPVLLATLPSKPALTASRIRIK